eukprot:6003858-Amphidinium_carterae.1
MIRAVIIAAVVIASGVELNQALELKLLLMDTSSILLSRMVRGLNATTRARPIACLKCRSELALKGRKHQDSSGIIATSC